MRHHKNNKPKRLLALGAIAATICAPGLPLWAQTNSAAGDLEKENQQLKDRVSKLENMMQKEGLMASADKKDPPVAAMSEISLSGFVTSSYFYDAASSKDKHPTGYLWNGAMNQFTLNKAQLVFQSPAVSKDKWDAGFFLSLLYGEDQTVNDSSGGPYSAIRQAYVDLNIPVGTGLDVKVGEMTSLLNYESGDGGVVNDNFSQSYQWWYTGNGPAETVQVSYDFNDKFGVKVRLQNGLYNGEVGNGPKTFMGGLYFKPTSKSSLALIGFAGQQDNIGVPVYHLEGGSFIGSIQLVESCNLTFATEGDFFHFANFSPSPGATRGDFWSIGTWVGVDLDPKWRLALRAEFLDDPRGFGTILNSPNPAAAEGYAGTTPFPGSIYATDEGQELTDITLTLNFKPTPNVKIQPEIRWNHSTVSAGFNGKSDQVIIGMGASYAF